ncbi:MAG: YicC/YloC family endoribonuclease [Puniceicoccales bacterium]
MQSMTGFGRGEARNEHVEITVEVSSVNRKSLEVGVSLPRDWQSLERDITEAVRGCALRGKVSVYVQVRKGAQGGGLDWDDEKVLSTVRRLETFAHEHGMAIAPDGDLLLRVINSLDTGSELPEADAAKPLLMQAVGAALEGFAAMRASEGEALKKDLLERLAFLEDQVVNMRTVAEEVVPTYREQLFARLQKAGLELELDDERVLKEICLFADRADISEELTRLSSHIEQFRATLEEEGAIGRKMDFLCQEIHREVNTSGSKANQIELTRIVIDCKNELERIREQAQNVE